MLELRSNPLVFAHNSMFEEDYFSKLNHEKKTKEWQLFYAEQISRLLKCLNPREKDVSICDVGCGFGEFLGLCDGTGWATFGMDISEFAISEARKRTRARLSVGDIQTGIPFEQQFDIITCFDVVEHLENPQVALAVVKDHLKSGGMILMTTPNVRAHFMQKLFRQAEDETHISVKRMQQWSAILRTLGFDVSLSWTIYPVASYKGGAKSSLAKLFSLFGLGSTACFLAAKKTTSK